MRWPILVLVLLLVPQATATVPGGLPADSATAHPQVTAIYANPVPTGDPGEFVVVTFPARTNLSTWTLDDGESRVRLGNRTVAGRVAFTAHPDRVRSLTDAPVVGLDGFPALANGGERLRLRRATATVDTVSYLRAPEASVYRPAAEERWRPLGATEFPVVTTGPTTARAFVLPDARGLPVAVLRNASDRILLAGYTLTSERVADAVLAAHERGVRVRVLVEGSPVGGLPRREARLLDRLAAADVDVRVLAGPYARYDFHHAKYAVVDDSALVITENWKPAGTGGRSSRGWGVVLDDSDAAAALATTFRADAGWRDARRWPDFRAGRAFPWTPAANGTFPSRFAPERVRARNVSVLVAPENAEQAVLDRIDAADEAVRVVQPTVGGPAQPFVAACLRAARRGVQVRVLVSGAWYVREENERLVAELDRRATAADLPLSARVAQPRGRFEKIHAKGLIVDDAVVLGSLNWNNNSARENREVLVALESEAAADYYGRVFRADWRGAAWRLPGGLVAVLAVAALVAFAVGRRIEFA